MRRRRGLVLVMYFGIASNDRRRIHSLVALYVAAAQIVPILFEIRPGKSALRQVRSSRLMDPRAGVHLLSGSLHRVVLQLSRRIGDSHSLDVVAPRVGPILGPWSP